MINPDDVIYFGQWNLCKKATKLRQHEGLLMKADSLNGIFVQSQSIENQLN